MNAGEWIALAAVVLTAMAGLAGLVKGLVSARMRDTEQKAVDAHARLHAMELELARNYVRRDELSAQLNQVVAPINKRLDFQGRILAAIADRMDIPTVELQEPASV